MKKIISFLLVFVLFTVNFVFADTTSSAELQKVLVLVKSKIEVPTELSEFESHISNYNDIVYYNFDWHSPDYEKSLSVSADSEGHITNYNNYSEKITDKKLSGVSRTEIIDFADSFLKKALPDMYKDLTDVLMLDSDTYNASGNSRYSFTYNRYKNVLPVRGQGVSVTVCVSEDNILYIRSMSANIDYNATFGEKAEELEDYVQKYREAFPLELIYQDEYNPNWKEKGETRTTPALVYRLKDNITGFLSVESWNVIEEDSYDEIFRDESTSDNLAGSGSAEKGESLTEQELAEIAETSKLLSVSQIENKIKSLPHIKLPSGVKLTNSNLYKKDGGEYIYNLHYNSDKNNEYKYANISVYAKDGKLISYNCSSADDSRSSLSTRQQETAQNKIEEFLKITAGEEFSQCTLRETNEINGYLNVYYNRVVNGIKHDNNGISVSFDGKNSAVASYYLNFTDGEFEDPQKAVTAEKAYDNIIMYAPVIRTYVRNNGKYLECLTLEKHGVIADALTGAIKNEIKQQGSSDFSYEDVSGHWVEEAATKLSEIQLGFRGNKLNPDSQVTQEDFLRLMASGIYGKYYQNYSSEDLYNNLIREKVINEEEKNPSSAVFREDAFVYIIRMANLEKVAKLTDIYKVTYRDEAKLSPERLGYCAILSGFGVICGSKGYLRPKDNLTRAEAITMLYRFLLTI